jgi:hypothetical protein
MYFGYHFRLQVFYAKMGDFNMEAVSLSRHLILINGLKLNGQQVLVPKNPSVIMFFQFL